MKHAEIQGNKCHLEETYSWIFAGDGGDKGTVLKHQTNYTGFTALELLHLLTHQNGDLTSLDLYNKPLINLHVSMIHQQGFESSRFDIQTSLGMHREGKYI